MIIFYNKNTNRIYGVVEGRVHDNPEKELIKTSDIADEDIGKYVVPYKTLYQTIDVPIKKFFIKNKKTGEVEERVIGTKKEEVPSGMIPDVPFAAQIIRFERKQDDIFNYSVKIEKDQVIGFIKTN